MNRPGRSSSANERDAKDDNEEQKKDLDEGCEVFEPSKELVG